MSPRPLMPITPEDPVLVIVNDYRAPIMYWRVQFGRRSQVTDRDELQMLVTAGRIIEVDDDRYGLLDLFPHVEPLRIITRFAIADEYLNSSTVAEAKARMGREAEKHAKHRELRLTDVVFVETHDDDFHSQIIELRGFAR